MGLTNFPNGITSFGVPVLGGIGGIPFTGKYWFVDPVNGLDGNQGTSPSQALQSLYRAQLLAVAGRNDVVVLIGNGASSGTARLSKEAAQAVDSTATSGVLNWAKNAVHLVGVTAPTANAQRARIAPPTGVYTQANFGSGNFVNVTGAGCYFSNFSLFHGFSTGGTNQICWTENGGRNAYSNVDFGGIADAASGADAGSRSLKVTGTGENSFYHCTVGLDTVARSVANASLELAGGTPRNVFEDCLFPFYATNSAVLAVLGTGDACIDRTSPFRRCDFLNAIKSGGSTAMTAGVSFTTGAPGGLLYFKSCGRVGITAWGDTNGLANMYIDTPAVSASTNLAVNPS